MMRATDGGSVWGEHEITQPRPLEAARDAARVRWGAPRVATVIARSTWRGDPAFARSGLSYGKVGPNADAGVLGSGWSLLERGVADAVEILHESPALACGLLLERAADATVTLRKGTGPDGPNLQLAQGLLPSVVMAIAAVELGIPLEAGGSEPERVRAGSLWMVEVRA